MRVIEIKDIHRNDCTMILICEYCSKKYTDTSAYNDDNYIYNVIPNFHCKKCKLNSKGELKNG